ncbi:MAG: hypothetical protein HY376_03140 [Candidatus Blackburnbacteria bacterium]|nr:hypothetical protein [Candidatus Blackburnbacteria bacterium]
MNKPILVSLTIAIITTIYNVFVINYFPVIGQFGNISLFNFITIRFFEIFTVIALIYWAFDFLSSFFKHHTVLRTVAVTLVVWLVEASPFITLQNTVYWMIVVTISQLVWDKIGGGS